ncbi:MAG TPA: hypothetical protein VEC14_01170 [Reyranellaceae bacterium]|nr:hypothetical protein [Reyranellaceae bacterium]
MQQLQRQTVAPWQQPGFVGPLMFADAEQRELRRIAQQPGVRDNAVHCGICRTEGRPAIDFIGEPLGPNEVPATPRAWSLYSYRGDLRKQPFVCHECFGRTLDRCLAAARAAAKKRPELFQ